jgi:putative endonuclease
MFYTYILQSLKFPNQTYIGFTQDLENRLHEHNSQQSAHSKKFSPGKYMFYAAFPTQTQVINFEKYLKTGSERLFIKKHCRLSDLHNS